MTIANLIKAVPPPEAPTYAFDGPWEPIEGPLRTALPQDYKDLARVYGDGSFLDLIGVFGPPAQLRQEMANARQILEHTRHPLYPQPGGLLACGSVDNGCYILWLTRGASPEEWPIVIWDGDAIEGNDLIAFDCDLTDFIAGVVSGDILFPGYEALSDYSWGQAKFTPTPDPFPEV